MTYSVAIVDDHLLIAKALGSIISQFRSYEVIAEMESGEQFFHLCHNKKQVPDILLLDVSMPVMDGFEVARQVKEKYPQMLVMALSMQDDEQTIIRMIKSGARGYLHKNVHPSELEKALQELVTKGYYYPEWATNKLIRNIAFDNPESQTVKLSDREVEFLNYACTELTYKEISEKMFCSPRTVESYRDTLFEKLNLHTRVGLALYAVKNGLVKI